MSHNHGHGGCGDHAHEHELPGNVLGYQDNLYGQIDRAHVVALNANGRGQTVIKPWSERDDEVSYLESDADDQLILRIPFTASVKLRALLLKAGPGDNTPTKVLLFANEITPTLTTSQTRLPLRNSMYPREEKSGSIKSGLRNSRIFLL